MVLQLQPVCTTRTHGLQVITGPGRWFKFLSRLGGSLVVARLLVVV
jgi:hypothetical protein